MHLVYTYKIEFISHIILSICFFLYDISELDGWVLGKYLFSRCALSITGQFASLTPTH